MKKSVQYLVEMEDRAMRMPKGFWPSIIEAHNLPTARKYRDNLRRDDARKGEKHKYRIVRETTTREVVE